MAIILCNRSRDDEALSDSDRELADFNEDEDNHDQDKQHRSDFYDEDDEEEEENKSLISSFSSIRSLKSQEKSEDLFADSSSDEELLTSGMLGHKFLCPQSFVSKYLKII